jgi:type IV pilus assembly protein PilW
MNLQISKRSHGFTLVELMVAMTLGLLLCVAITKLYLGVRSGFDRDEEVVRMQDDARQAVRNLGNDLSTAGFWADLVLPGAVTKDLSLAVGTDCGPAASPNWIYDPVTGANALSVTGVDNATGSSANAAYSCISAGEILAGTDVIAVKRVAGARLTGAAVTNKVYLRTNGTLGLLYKEPANSPPAVTIPAPFTEWEYRPAIYYIRNFANVAGDGIPTLCRKVLVYGAGAPNVNTECLAQGIENLQVEYGLDPDGDAQPNVFVPSPTLAQLQTAVAARIYVLARSTDADPQYTNAKTYQLSNAASYTPNDKFYRRVFSLTVGFHNLSSLRKLRS